MAEVLSGASYDTMVVADIRGEPGIGKTRFLGDVQALGAERGYVVCVGRAGELERQRPFGPVVDALGGVVGSIVAGLPDEEAALLRHVRPASNSAGFGPGTSGRNGARLPIAQRYRVHRAVRTLLEKLASGTGLLLILDDVHWADDGSLELFSYLLRYPARARVVLALAHRPRQAPPALQTALTGAGRLVRRFELGPLSEPDGRLLLAGVPEQYHRQLYRLSGGNPFYLEVLAAAAAADWLPTPGDDTMPGDAVPVDAVPPAVRSALSAEVDALTKEQIRVARSAAVAGDPFDADLVAYIADLDANATLAAIDVLCRRDLVRGHPAGAGFTSRHPLIRGFLYAGASMGQRSSAHARADECLRRRGAPAVERAHHLERSALPGDLAAAATLVEAAQTVLPSVPTTAVRWIQAAMRLLPDTASAHAYPRFTLAKALTSLGRLTEARDMLNDMLTTVSWDDPPRRAAVLVRHANLELMLGHQAAAREQLMAELHTAPPAFTAGLQLEIAKGFFNGGDYETTKKWAVRALDGARGATGQRTTEAGAAGLLALSHNFTGDMSSARTYATRAASVIDALLDSELIAMSDALVWTGWAEVFLEAFGAATRHFARTLDLARSGGQGHLIHESHIGLATGRIWEGALAEAWTLTEDALDTAVLVNSDRMVAKALTRQCQIALFREDVADALRAGEQAMRVVGPDDMWSGIAAGILAEAKLAAGGHDAAVRDMLDAGGGPELRAFGVALRPAWYDTLTEAELRRGRLAAADAWASRAEAAADVVRLTGRYGFAARARARVLRARRDLATAAMIAVRAAECFETIGARTHEAQTRTLAGQICAEAGDTARARHELTRAKLLFAQCGAAGPRRRVLDGLRRLGARKPRRAAAAAPVLTGREREIAELVATGMTNRQIAGRLGLSEKTVETHLGRVFRKFGLSSRAALAARLPARSRHGTATR